MIEALLPATVIAVEAFGDDPREPVFPGEEVHVANAVPARWHEFVTARRCARTAIGKLGFPPGPIGRGPRREPLWPHGVVGAITHCSGYRAAAVATDLAAIGIDAEPNGPLPAGVDPHITTPGEPAMLAELTRTHPTVHWSRMLFSAKESVYKAWYPLTGRWLGFDDAVLSIDPAAGTFHARLVKPGACDPAAFDGRFLVAGGLILTAVTLE
jgi:4'-phosphopantetheinyl transferase EntD